MVSCKHMHWARIVGIYPNDVKIRWCSMCGSIFHKVRLNNGEWSKRSRWIHPRKKTVPL